MPSCSRRAALTAVALATALLGAAAPAGADPENPSAGPIVTVLTEQTAPAGATPFVDDPSIVDGRAQAIESWSRLPDDHTIAVQFTSGNPACYGVHAEVQETTDIVAVKLMSGARPGSGERVCTMIAVPGTLVVGLPGPVGNRAVVSLT